MLLIIHLATTALFLLLGVVFLCGKGEALVAGYNTMPPEEKAKIDGKKLTKFMGKLMLGLAACWLVVASSEIFHTMALLWIGLGLSLITAIAGVAYMNTGNRFQRR